MLIIGLLIAAAAAAFAAVVLSENWGGAVYTVHGFGHTLGSLTLSWIFLCGIIIAAIFFFAMWMASASTRMRHRASMRRRAETRAIREEHEAALADRDRLARELEAERAGRPAHDTTVIHDRPVVDERGAAYPRAADVYREPVAGEADSHRVR